MLLPLVIALCVQEPVPKTQAPASKTPTELEALVDRLGTQAIERDGVPGLSVAVMIDGEVVLTRGFGWADERRGLKMQPATTFPIGSLGRQFTSAAALLAVDRGTLALDTKLGMLLPGIPAAFRTITFGQLLNGTSGLPAAADTYPKLAARAKEGPLSRADFLALLGEFAPTAAPGERFAADTTAWMLLPLIVADATKKPLPEFVRAELFEPLGLHATSFCAEAPGTLGHAEDCHDVEQGCSLEIWSGAEPLEARTNLCSTAADLLRWQVALAGHALLSEASMRVLTESPQTKDTKDKGEKKDKKDDKDKEKESKPLESSATMELGDLGGTARWRHDGGIGGWRVCLGAYGPGKVGVCVLANCASAKVGAIEDELARFALRLPPREVLDLPLTAADFTRLGGNYQLGTTRVRIYERDGGLWYESPAEERFRLRSQGLSRFVSANGDVRLVFETEAAKAESFEETRKGATSVARRME